jgi:hypothetical protein
MTPVEILAVCWTFIVCVVICGDVIFAVACMRVPVMGAGVVIGPLNDAPNGLVALTRPVTESEPFKLVAPRFVKF